MCEGKSWNKPEPAITVAHHLNQSGGDFAVVKEGDSYFIRPLRIALGRKYCIVWPSQTPMTQEAIADEQYLRGKRTRGYNGRR